MTEENDVADVPTEKNHKTMVSIGNNFSLAVLQEKENVPCGPWENVEGYIVYKGKFCGILWSGVEELKDFLSGVRTKNEPSSLT